MKQRLISAMYEHTLFRYSFICQGTSTSRRQRRDHFDLRIKLPPVTTSL